ncbi:MAG: response regulator [bacterium]|nr:response regulator [bacterium]
MTTLQPLRILVVDDEEIVRRILINFISEHGHRVDAAGDSTSALEALEMREYDLALVDLRMPGSNGLDLIARMRAQYPHLSVILIAGFRDEDITAHALKLGVAGFLNKPFEFLELESLLVRCAPSS